MWYRTVGGIVTLMLSLLTAPLTSQAQPAAHVPRLGLLMPGSASGYASRLEAFRHGLRDLGYVKGHNIALDTALQKGRRIGSPRWWRNWSGSPWTSSSSTGRFAPSCPARHHDLPIVMVAGDPVGARFVVSLAHRGRTSRGCP